MEEQNTITGLKLNRKSIFGIAGVLVLLIAVGLGTVLIQQKQLLIFKPKAAEVIPPTPETSFALEGQSKASVGEQIKVIVRARSDIDAANLFAAKLKFPSDLLEVMAITTGSKSDIVSPICTPRPGCLDENPTCQIAEPPSGWCPEVKTGTVCAQVITRACSGESQTIKRTDGTVIYGDPQCKDFPTPCDVPAGWKTTQGGDNRFLPGEPNPNGPSNEGGPMPPRPVENLSFIKNWVENTYDNSAGTVSLVGGVPDLGYQTAAVDPPGVIAEITFKVKKEGSVTISFDGDSAIYRNSDNVNILTIKRDLSIEVNSPQVKKVAQLGEFCGGITGIVCAANLMCQFEGTGNDMGGKCIEAPVKPNPDQPIFQCGEQCGGGAVARCADGLVCQNPGNQNPDNQKLIDGPTGRCVNPQCPDASTCSCSGQVTPTSKPSPIPNLVKGDINNDGKVTLVDVSAFLSQMGKKVDVSNNSIRADLNGDGVINGIDFSLMKNILITNKIIKG